MLIPHINEGCGHTDSVVVLEMDTGPGFTTRYTQHLPTGKGTFSTTGKGSDWVKYCHDAVISQNLSTLWEARIMHKVYQ